MAEDYERLDETSVVGDSTKETEERPSLSTGDVRDKSIEDSMTYYNIAKPRRITIFGRVTHDPGRYKND